jgi:hypothetical protein
MPRHPEQIEAIVSYLRQFKRSRRLMDACLCYLKAVPYRFVRGELFHLVAGIANKQDCRRVLDDAVAIAKDSSAGVTAKWGALVFLCKCEELGLGRYSRFVLGQPALVQALTIPCLPPGTLFSGKAVKAFLARKALEPGLAFAEQLIVRRRTLASLGVVEGELPSQVRNVLFELGVIPGKPSAVDPMAEILSRRYGIPKEPVWRALFAGEYLHALQELTQAEKLFDMGRSQWLNYQNSFNHAAFLALQEHLNRLGLPGACRTKNKIGELIKYGTMLDGSHPFGTACPTIAGAFRAANSRRNKLDSSHPYDEKTGSRNSPLKRREQGTLVGRLASAYSDVLKLCLTHGIR